MSNADTGIATLRSEFDDLAAQTSTLSDQQLAGPTGAEEWDVSQVLSHLGSGAEIMQNALRVSLEGKPNPGAEFNKTVWARYDAAGARDRLEWFLTANKALIQSLESLSDETRQSLRIDLGFLPEPVDVARFASGRLSEFALHSWDVRVGFDPAATVTPAATAHLLPGCADYPSYTGRPDALDGTTAVIAVTTTDPGESFTLTLGEKISASIGSPEHSDGTLTLPAEAWLRLVTGRLKPQYTPEGITATGATDLDLLRRVFANFG
jgi:uncharacterized protein (TIGR03083 family)